MPTTDHKLTLNPGLLELKTRESQRFSLGLLSSGLIGLLEYAKFSYSYISA
jgi:hypothetical protein